MPLVVFEPAISAVELRQSYALDSPSTGSALFYFTDMSLDALFNNYYYLRVGNITGPYINVFYVMN